MGISDLSPFDAAILYWRGLDAPTSHVAHRLRASVENVLDAERRLAAMGYFPPAAELVDLKGYPSAVSWEDRTANVLIRKGLMSRPDEAPFVLVGGHGMLTAGEVRAGVAWIAAGLAAAGIGAGDRVAVDATQRLESYLVILAALLSGAAVVALTQANGPDALRAMIGAAPSKITFTSCGSALSGLSAAGCVVDLGPVTKPTADFDAWLASCPEVAGDVLPDVCVSPGDVAVVAFTSGSTGAPKCVLTPHESVFRQTEAMQKIFGFGSDDVFASPTEIIGFNPFRSLITQPFMCGGRVVLPSVQALSQPLALAEDCAAYGVTQLTVVTNVLRGLAKVADRLPPGAFDRVRTVFCGSGVLDQDTHDLFCDRFGVRVIDYFAAREFNTVLLAQSDSDHTVSSAGGDVINSLLRLIDESGNAVSVGEVGEIVVHSDCLAISPLAESRPCWAGWHQTGDLGVLRPDGRVQIVGRRRDIIKVADGSLIFPVEIESQLNTLDWVQESCVLGWQAEGEPERVIAALILKYPIPDYQSLARQHVLKLCGQYRTPARVFALEEFPRLGLSKVDRPSLLSILEPALGTGSSS